MLSLEDVKTLEEVHICHVCVGEEYLSNEIRLLNTSAKCKYCDSETYVIPIGELAEYISTAFEQHFYATSDNPEGYDYYLQKEGLWEQPGEPVIDVISEAALIDEKPAEDIREILEYENYDRSAAEIGEEGPFDEGVYYAEKSVDDSEYRAAWASFEEGLISESRFFSKSAQTMLNDLFKDLNELKTLKGKSVIVQAGPGTELESIFRTRIFQSETSLLEALKNPDQHLGPPSSRFAKAGRMNPQGISVFYGATTAEIAIAEVRPPVGSRALVGRFEIIRPIRLLDVEAIHKVPVTGSFFDYSFLDKLERHKFLERLGSRISQPVMPNDEPFDYLATQAIAEYLSETSDPPLDGILFNSAQTKKAGKNIVLFHRSAGVERFEIPENTDITASFFKGYDEDDHYEEDSYHVWEETPDPKNDSKEQEKKSDEPFSFYLEAEKSKPKNIDYFEQTTLKLDPKSLIVHRTDSVAYRTKEIKVSRTRMVKGSLPF